MHISEHVRASVLGALLLVLAQVSPVSAQASQTKSGGNPSGSPSGSPGGGGSGSGHGGGTDPDDNTAEVENVNFSHGLFLAMGGMASIILIVQMLFIAKAYVRHVVCISGSGNQKYWSQPDSWFLLKFKKSLLWAPLFSKRHNREFRLSAATSVGTLPSRLQTIILLAIVASNVIFTFFSIEWASPNKIKMLSELRNRAGILSTVNLIPLFVCMARWNLLIPLLGCSYDGFNMMHRWIGRIVVVEALIHTFAWMASKVLKMGWPAVQQSITHSPFILNGFIATVAFTALLLLSPSIIRHAFYDTFLGIHILLALLAVVTLYQHLAIKQVEHWLIYVKVTMLFWGLERFMRFASILYRNIGISTASSTATVTALDDACRVEITMPRPWSSFKPGQHVFLMIPGLSWSTWWQSHPFSVCWSDDGSELTWDEKGQGQRNSIYAPKKPKIELIVRRRTGFTAKLFDKVNAAPSGKLVVKCLVEGPYGGLHTLESYGSVFLAAGGVGITHQLPYLRELLNAYSQGISPIRRITLCWVLNQPTHLQWVKSHMTKILAMEGRREVLKVLLFVTQPNHSREIMSPSSTVQLYPGKPNFDELLSVAIADRIGTMAVNVCGPGSLADDVRAAVRAKGHIGSVDFFEESFSW